MSFIGKCPHELRDDGRMAKMDVVDDPPTSSNKNHEFDN